MAELTPFKRYLEQWREGCGSELCSRANNIVHARGDLPCELAFLGEAPGESEDTSGKPFVEGAPSGRELMKIITRALAPLNAKRHERGRPPFSLAFFNLLGCIPVYPPGSESRKNSKRKPDEPDDEDIMQCLPRCQALLEIAKPKILFAVGKHSRVWTEPGIKGNLRPDEAVVVPVVHPSAILQANAIHRGLMRQKAEAAIRTAIIEHYPEGI